MKAKMSFNSKAIQAFLFAHVEKFVFGLVVVVMLFFIAGAMDPPGYEKTPEELKKIAEEADRRIAATPTPPEEERYDNVYETKSDLMRIPVEPAGYKYSLLWTPFLWPRPAVRNDPMLYTVEELRAEPGHGAVRVRMSPTEPQAPVSGVEGQRWVVVTGLIPYKKQWDAYVEAFGEAQFKDPDRDIPKIVWYLIQRAEVVSPGEVAQPNWVTINPTERLVSAARLWNGIGPEVVNPKYVVQDGSTRIVFPLPPVDGKPFGREVVHDPEIPLAAEEPPERLLPQATPEEDPALQPPDLPMLPPEDIITVKEQEEEELDVLEYALFRFFDFDVEPGKHYMYRVQLWLPNPNYQVEARFLADDSLREKQWLTTPWSEPTELTTVPRDARVLIGSVKPAPGGRVTMEPRATVGIPYFYFDKGVEVFDKFDVLRGRYLNFPEQEVPAESLNPAGPRPGYDEYSGSSEYSEDFLGSSAAPSSTAAKSKEEEEPVKLDFNTETVLLDMVGGERIAGRDRDLTAPGMLLLLDPDGQLVVQNELDDKTEYEQLAPPEEKKPKKEMPMDEEGYYSGSGSSEDSYEYEMMMQEQPTRSRRRR